MKKKNGKQDQTIFKEKWIQKYNYEDGWEIQIKGWGIEIIILRWRK